MKNAILLLNLLLIFACQNLAEAQSNTQKSPNILYILVDQWRAQTAGYSGNMDVITPNLDRLALESINLKNAISGTPVCTPHRASLMTGQYPLTNGVFMNDVLLDTNAITLSKVFNQNNYNTAFIGKWHLDGHGRNTFIPPTRQQGFAYWKTLECTHNYNNSAYYSGDSNQKKLWEGYDASAQTDDVLNYLDKQANAEKPFLLMLSIGSPHAPYETAPPEFRELYENKEITLRENVPAALIEQVLKDTKGYYAHMTAIDTYIGKMWQKLIELDLEENTIIVFTSDHGDLLGSHGFYKKQQPYQESIKVPFLIHYPKIFTRAGQTKETLLNSPDIMPTLLGLSNIHIPESVEGVDFSDVLKGKKKDKIKYTLISCPQPFGQWARKVGGKEYRGLFTGKYTYTRDLAGPWLLFDNDTDPFQMNNLIGKAEYKILQESLDKNLNKELKKRNDEFRPGMEYVKKWNYLVDETETVPYIHVNYQGKPIIE
jgi:arylsulfatase A-like enzyme